MVSRRSHLLPFATTTALVVAAMQLYLEPSMAHSWIDCIDTDRSVVYDKASAWIYGGETSNGRCKGYITNYPGRGDPAINSKMTHKILMHDVIAGAAPCPTFSSMTGGDAKGFPHLKMKAGEEFYYGYLDNGHTSKDKAGRGTFYGVYWTGESGTSLKSTTDLTDDRLIDGKLHDFDDKNCGQTWEDGDFTGTIPSGRAGNDYPCVGDVIVPVGTKPGTYNLIWFWRFYNDKINADIATTGGHYGGAAYSSCFQVEVVGGEVENEAEESYNTPAPTELALTTPAPTTETPAPTTSTAAPAPTTASPYTEAPSPASGGNADSAYASDSATPVPTTTTGKSNCGVHQSSGRRLRA